MYGFSVYKQPKILQEAFHIFSEVKNVLAIVVTKL